jgi:hypothetical protein
MDLRIVSGAGSVISNVLDYTKWIKALLNTSGPISKRGYNALLASRSILEKHVELPSPYTGPEAYSLGWFTGTYQGYEFFTHSGGMEAFGAEIIFFPKLMYGIASLGNTGVTSNMVEERLMWHLIDEKIGVPEEDRFDWNKRCRFFLVMGFLMSANKGTETWTVSKICGKCIKTPPRTCTPRYQILQFQPVSHSRIIRALTTTPDITM